MKMLFLVSSQIALVAGLAGCGPSAGPTGAAGAAGDSMPAVPSTIQDVDQAIDLAVARIGLDSGAGGERMMNHLLHDGRLSKAQAELLMEILNPFFSKKSMDERERIVGTRRSDEELESLMREYRAKYPSDGWTVLRQSQIVKSRVPCKSPSGVESDSAVADNKLGADICFDVNRLKRAPKAMLERAVFVALIREMAHLRGFTDAEVAQVVAGASAEWETIRKATSTQLKVHLMYWFSEAEGSLKNAFGAAVPAIGQGVLELENAIGAVEEVLVKLPNSANVDVLLMPLREKDHLAVKERVRAFRERLVGLRDEWVAGNVDVSSAETVKCEWSWIRFDEFMALDGNRFSSGGERFPKPTCARR